MVDFNNYPNKSTKQSEKYLVTCTDFKKGVFMGSSQTKPHVEINDNVALEPVVSRDHPNFNNIREQLVENDKQYRINHKLILDHYQEVMVLSVKFLTQRILDNLSVR